MSTIDFIANDHSDLLFIQEFYKSKEQLLKAIGDNKQDEIIKRAENLMEIMQQATTSTELKISDKIKEQMIDTKQFVEDVLLLLKKDKARI